MTNDNKTREQELAAATAHYMRTAGDLFRAHNRSIDDPLGFDRATEADSKARDRLHRVLDTFPKDEADKLWKDILAARKKQ